MTITINGKACQCEKGEYLLQVARRCGFVIPTLCHHSAIEGQGCCRLCIVEVVDRGRSQIVVSCVYPVEKEITVFTDSEKVRRERGMILRLLQKRAPDSEEIRQLCSAYNAPEIKRFTEADRGKCILCGLCAKACNALYVGAISTVSRGTAKEIATPYHEPSSVCVGCGSCASICPTHAIDITQTETTRTIWGKTFRLVRCANCGSIIGTREELELAAKRSGGQPDTLCPECRKLQLADTFSHTFGE